MTDVNAPDSVAATTPSTDPVDPSDAAESPFKKRLLVFILPSMAALFGVYTGVQQVLLPAQVEAIDAAAKVQNLAVISAVAAIAATIALPVGGALSDRTRTRLGRRAPWILGSALVAAGLLTIMGTLNSITALAVLFGLLWFTLNVYQAAIYAIIPDRIPERIRGTASAIVGVASPVGVLIAVNAVARTSTEIGYIGLGIGLVVFAAALLFGAPDRSSVDLVRPPKNADGKRRPLQFFQGFRSLDFTMVFISRAAIFLAYGAITGYLFYVLSDYIDPATLPAGGIAVAVSTVVTISTVGNIVVALVVGPLADKLNRRKLIVAFSAVGLAVALVIPLFFPTWGGLLAYAIIGSISIGAYNTVDVALMSMVLPNKHTEGRDLALLSASTSGALILSPIIAALFVTATGGYAAIFIFAAVMSLIGALTLLPVKNIR